jgi:phage N-6-adenine-methyltransferase
MEEIIINPEFKELIPLLAPDEYEGLEKSIITEGCRDALVLWNQTIVDGHNRYEICKKHNIEFQTIQMDFPSIEYAKEWIILNQYSRRNLNSYQRGVLALKLEKIYKTIAKANQKLSKGRGRKGAPQVAGIKGDVRDKLAKAAKLSHGNIDKIKVIEDKATKETKKLLESGELSINQVYKQLKEPAQSHNSGTNDWHSPSDIIEAARVTMGGIDLDPASSEKANETIKATQIYTEQTNGLDKPWSGNVWMNPPYAQPLMAKFAEKFIKELPNIKAGIVIVNNATETKWFKNLSEKASAICLVTGRVKFLEPMGSKGHPLQGQVILYFGNDAFKFKEHFSRFGQIWIHF